MWGCCQALTLSTVGSLLFSLESRMRLVDDIGRQVRDKTKFIVESVSLTLTSLRTDRSYGSKALPERNN